MLSNETVDDFVMTTIAETCNFDRSAIDRRSSVAEIGMDSLRLTAFVAHVEAAFDCELSADQIVTLFEAPHVQDIVTLIKTVAAASSR